MANIDAWANRVREWVIQKRQAGQPVSDDLDMMREAFVATAPAGANVDQMAFHDVIPLIDAYTAALTASLPGVGARRRKTRSRRRKTNRR
jgi:hypothetical protein